MLKQRVITAVILALIVVGSLLFLDSFYVALLFSLILLVSIQELARMTLSNQPLIQWVAAFSIVALFFIALPEISIRLLAYQSFFGLLLWLLILLFMLRYSYSGKWSKNSKFSLFFLSALLLLFCVNGLLFIHQHFEQGGWMLLYLLSLVWVADIGAYFSGKSFGKNKLAPGISPGKTREGVLGGLILNSMWISAVYFISQGWGMAYTSFLVLGILTAAISVIGDLYESILKREAGLKDSGKILPGHGGVLDRIDSIIAATPVYISGLFFYGAV